MAGPSISTGWISIFLFAASTAAFLYVGPTAPQGGDTVPNRYLAAGMAACGDTTLDRYSALWGGDPDRPPYYATRAVTGELVSTFGPWVPLLSSPAFMLADLLGTRMDFAGILRTGRVLAAVLCGAAVTFVFLACTNVAGILESLASATAFALGSGVLTVASRGLWQHTWALPLLALGIWLVLASRTRAAAAGLVLALAFAVRPHAGFFLAAGAVLTFLRDRESLPWFLAGAFPVVAAVFALNTWYFDSPFLTAQAVRSLDVAQFKTGARSLWSSTPWTGVAGLLASPSRGLLVWSPALALGLAGGASAAWAAFRSPGPRSAAGPATAVLFAACTAVFLLGGAWFDWWGGYTLTYRPVLEVLPALAVLTAWTLGRWRGRALVAAWTFALAWSILLSAAATTHPGAVAWNEEQDVDHHPERLWDVGGSLAARVLQVRGQDRIPLLDCIPVTIEGCEPRPDPALVRAVPGKAAPTGGGT